MEALVGDPRLGSLDCEYVVIHLHAVLILYNEPVYIHTDAISPIRL